MSNAGRRTGQIGAILGCAIAAALLARLVQVQTRPDGAGLLFALAYGGLLGLPFVASLAARRFRARHRAVVWLTGGLLSVLLVFSSVSPATLPLLVPGALLLIAGFESVRSRLTRGVR